MATHPYVNLAKGAGGGMQGINLCTFYLGALCAFISRGQFCHLKGLDFKLNVKHQGFGINAYMHIFCLGALVPLSGTHKYIEILPKILLEVLYGQC